MDKNPKTIPLDSKWVEWLRETLRVLNDGGVMAFPLRGVAYKLDRQARTLTVIVEHPHFDRQGDTAVITERCAGVLDYKVVYLDEPARTVEAMMEAIKKGNYIITADVAEKMAEFFHRNPVDQEKWPSRLRRSWQ